MYWLLISLFIITSILTIIYDLKIQKIPMLLLIVNYGLICYFVNYWFLFGIIFIIIAKIKDIPIDILYIIILCYLIIILHNNLSIIAITIVLIQTLLSKNEKVSFMVSLELAVVFEIILQEVLK